MPTRIALRFRHTLQTEAHGACRSCGAKTIRQGANLDTCTRCDRSSVRES